MNVERNAGQGRFQQEHPIDLCVGQMRIAMSVDEAREIAAQLNLAAGTVRPEAKRLNRVLWNCGPCQIRQVPSIAGNPDFFLVIDQGSRQQIGARNSLEDAVDLVRQYCKA
jgi:hypothetical protein